MSKNPKSYRYEGCRIFSTCSTGEGTPAVDDRVVMLVWGVDIVRGAETGPHFVSKASYFYITWEDTR